MMIQTIKAVKPSEIRKSVTEALVKSPAPSGWQEIGKNAGQSCICHSKMIY